jgi:hypothetical protein
VTSLLEIAETHEVVAGVKCYGISVKGIAQLLARFPELKNLIAGQSTEAMADRLIEIAPDAVAAIIAMGTREIGETAEQGAASLPVETQYDFLAAIGRQTMPGGIGPFVEKMQSLSALADGFAQGVEQRTQGKS